MGQKINPIGLRLGINRGWDSTWFAKKKDFGKYLIEDFKMREYIKKNITNSGVSEVIIERSSKKCTVSIHTSRPGFVIGKKGSDIEKIKKNLMKITESEVNVNISFPITTRTEVKGENAHEFFIWAKENHGKSAIPKWNFHKILINKKGKVEDTFASFTKPTSKKIINSIKNILQF